MDTTLYKPFINSVSTILNQMANIQITPEGDFYPESEEITSYGVSSIIAYAGTFKGRLLLDMDKSLALAIANRITGENYETVKEFFVLASISELNNIIAGDGITVLNNQYSYGLRLAPPIVFAGKDTVISVPKIPSVTINCVTEFGRLRVNAAFERSM